MTPKKNRNTKGAAIAQAILSEYQPNNVEDMQEALKDIFGPMFEAMLQGEMDSHLAMKTMITEPRTPPIAEMAIRRKQSNPLAAILRAQLFNYGGAVRKVMYTTNAIESVNPSFRKVTKKGSFPNEVAVMNALYLRITELYKKWSNRPVSNWAILLIGDQ